MSEATAEKTEKDPKAKKAPKFIFIQNTSKRLHGIGKPQPSDQKGALVQASSINLVPGLNKVDFTAWEDAKKQKMVLLLITEDILRELQSADDFRFLMPDDAKKLIDLSNDQKMLEEWLVDDKRKEVQKALTARIEFLERPEPGSVKPDFGRVEK